MTNFILGVLSLFSTFFWVTASPVLALDTANPNANTATKDILLYLSRISDRQDHKVIVGQYAASAECCSENEIGDTGIAKTISPLKERTGKTPGLIGFDYNDYNIARGKRAVEYTLINRRAIEYAAAGSLITIGYHANNPWNKGPWKDTACPGRLSDIINPDDAVSRTWQKQLDHVADGLEELKRAGVTVLWRPFLEMNGTFFWWGACKPSKSEFRSVWLSMFRYFTLDRKLDNLLWVYAQNGMSPLPIMFPGGDVVDVIGFDDYHDAIAFDGYDNWLALGKPLALTERGPHETDGSSPIFETLLPKIAQAKWRVSYFQAYGVQRGLANNPGGFRLMNSSMAATQEDVKHVLDCMRTVSDPRSKRNCILASK